MLSLKNAYIDWTITACVLYASFDRSVLILGTLCNDDGDGYKTSLKK